MRRSLLPLLVLAGLVLVAPSVAADAGGGVGACFEYMYVADYHWYYLCVDTGGGLCAVYFLERVGMTYTRTCLLDALPVDTVEPGSLCVPTNGGGMDYHSQVCVQPGEPRCLVLSESHTDSGIRRECYGVPL